jgi:hypothetical protein
LTPGWVKKNQDPDPGSEYEMNNPDHISESLETVFSVTIFKFFAADPGSEMGKFGSGIRDGKKFGSGINIPDSQRLPAPEEQQRLSSGNPRSSSSTLPSGPAPSSTHPLAASCQYSHSK